jgi:hypothetical protein
MHGLPVTGADCRYETHTTDAPDRMPPGVERLRWLAAMLGYRGRLSGPGGVNVQGRRL